MKTYPPAVRLLLLLLVLLAPAFAVAARGEPTDEIPVPGGPASIRRLLGLDPSRPREAFFLELHEVLLAGAESRASWSQVERRRLVVEFAEDLSVWRRQFAGTAMAASPPGAWARTLSALGWLGLEVEGERDDFATRGRDDRDAMRRRTFPDALGTPMAVLLTRLRSGENVVLTASDDTAPLPFGLATWRELLGQPDLTAAAAFLELVRSVRASRLLVALHALDPDTRREVLSVARQIKAKDPGTVLLEDAYLGPLSRFPGALAISGGAFLLPGGKDAEPIWTDLFGVSPSRRPEFLRALLTVDGGKGAYVVDALQSLPAPAARALLLPAEGTRESPVARFRRLYRSIEKMGEGFAAGHRDPYDFAHVAALLRSDSAPVLALAADLDGDSFPATEAELAQIVSSAQRGAAKAKATPEDGLVRLLGREADRSSGAGALRRFVFVSTLVAGRPELADPATFALLLRGVDRFHPAYALLEDVPLDAPLVRKYLFALDRLNRRERSRDTEVASGLFQAAVELLAHAYRAASLGRPRAAELLAALLDLPAFAREDAPAPSAGPDVSAWISERLLRTLSGATASAEGAVGSVETTEETLSPDELLTRGLVGPVDSAVFAWRGGHYRYDPVADETRRRREFRETQRLASLEDVAAATRARGRLLSSDRASSGVAKAAAAELADRLGLSPGAPADEDERVRERFSRARERLDEIAAASERGWAASAATARAVPAEVDAALGERLLEALLAHVYAASAGDPNDLYYEDTNFVRRHSFRSVDRAGRLRETPFSATRLVSSFGGGGSRVSGSVFGLPDVLGLLHADQLTYGSGASLVNEQIRSGLVGMVRRVSPARLDDDALRFVEASCRATEDVATALDALVPADPDARLRVWTGLAGDLVPRARLALASARPPAGGASPLSLHLSPSDLYRIGRRVALGPVDGNLPVPESAREARRALEELERRAGAAGARERLAEFGPRAVAWAGKFRLTDLDLPAYERLAGYRMPGLLSDRLYDFKITVARTVAQAGLPAAVLPLVLPEALDEMMGGLKMAFAYDWRAIVRRSQAFGAADLERLLEQALRAGRVTRDHARDEAAGRS